MSVAVPLPEFSIIVPTHNRAAMLCRAITSVVSQTYDDYELIVVDDGSVDGTTEAVGAFADQHVRYLRLDRAGGVSAARNAGISAAHGRYISFLDDDDEFLPQFLEKMHQAIETAPGDVGFAWCGIERVALTGSGYRIDRVLNWQNVADKLAQGNYSCDEYLQVATSYGLTVRSECFDAVGVFDEKLQAAVDTDLVFRLGAHYSYTVVPEILVRLYMHPGDQLTDRNERRALAMERVIANNAREIGKSDHLWIRYHSDTAGLFYAIGNRGRGRYWMKRAIARQPFRWRTWKSWLSFELFGTEKLGLRRKVRQPFGTD